MREDQLRVLEEKLKDLIKPKENVKEVEEEKTISERKFLSRHTLPKKRFGGESCKPVKPYVIYTIKKPSTKEQEIWLYDNENHYLIYTVPPATEYHMDYTYVMDVTTPGYDYTLYKIEYHYKWYSSQNKLTAERGEIYESTHTGTLSQSTTRVTRHYNITGTTPDASIGTFAASEEYVRKLIVPPLWQTDSGNVTFDSSVIKHGNRFYPRPSVFFYSGNLDPEDNYFTWEQIWTSGTVQAVLSSDPADPVGFNLVPWMRGTAADGALFGLPNYENETWYTTQSESGETIYNYNTIRIVKHITSWHGSLSISIPPGQSKPPPEPAYSDFVVHTGYDKGGVYFLIKDTRRPVGRGPGEAGQAGNENDPTYTTLTRLKFVGNSVSTVSSSDLPLWMQKLDDLKDKNQLMNALTNTQYNSVLRYLYDELDRNYQDFMLKSSPIKFGSLFMWHLFVNVNFYVLENYLIGSGTGGTYSIAIAPVFGLPDDSSWEGARGESLFPTGEELKIKINKFQNPSNYDEDTFEVVNVVVSWTENNTVYACHDTNKIKIPDVSGS